MDGYILAAFLKEFLYFVNPENIVRVTSAIVKLSQANLSSNAKDFKSAVHKALLYFHPDKFDNTFWRTWLPKM